MKHGGDVRVRVFASTVSEMREASNVIADTEEGREDQTVVGAHLDSVPEGPGINDNGSGSATILEIAEKMSELGIEPRNRVRFAFWGAEELGLFGSKYYVAQLDERQLGDLAVYLNFDMVASPNYVRFIYGSSEVKEVFENFFGSRDLKAETMDLKGRSDHGPFAAEGIPVGGLFSGAEVRKTGSRSRSTAARRASPTTDATTRPATTLETSARRPWSSCPTARRMPRTCSRRGNAGTSSAHHTPPWRVTPLRLSPRVA